MADASPPPEFIPGTCVRRFPLPKLARYGCWFVACFNGGMMLIVLGAALASGKGLEDDGLLVFGACAGLMLFAWAVAAWDGRRTVRRLDAMARTLRLGAGCCTAPRWGFAIHPHLRGVRGGTSIAVDNVARKKSRYTRLRLHGPGADALDDATMNAALKAHRITCSEWTREPGATMLLVERGIFDARTQAWLAEVLALLERAP